MTTQEKIEHIRFYISQIKGDAPLSDFSHYTQAEACITLCWFDRSISLQDKQMLESELKEVYDGNMAYALVYKNHITTPAKENE